MKQSYQIRGMYCPNCEKRIMTALGKMDGVKAVRVDYASGRAEIESKKPMDREHLQSSLQNLGYELSNGSDELTRAASLLVIIRIRDGAQLVYSTLEAGSYPDITVQAGLPVRWTISAEEKSINGCNYTMVIPGLDLSLSFQPGENVLEFTPAAAGTIPYSCWMGMIRGTITVTD